MNIDKKTNQKMVVWIIFHFTHNESFCDTNKATKPIGSLHRKIQMRATIFTGKSRGHFIYQRDGQSVALQILVDHNPLQPVPAEPTVGNARELQSSSMWRATLSPP